MKWRNKKIRIWRSASHITGCLNGFSTCSKHYIYSLRVIFTIPYTGKQSCKQSKVPDSYTYTLLLARSLYTYKLLAVSKWDKQMFFDLKNSWSHENCSNNKYENEKGWHNNTLIMTFWIKAWSKKAKEIIVCCNRKQPSLCVLTFRKIIIQYKQMLLVE